MKRRRLFSAIGVLLLGLIAPGCDFDTPVSISIPSFGTLVVTTVTSGSNFDPNGYRLAVTGPSLNLNRDIGSNATTTFSIVRGCNCTVELTDIASNCTADANTKSVLVEVNRVATITFNVSCT